MVKLNKITLTIIVSVLSASLLFMFLYRFDNKYTHTSPQPVNGILKLENHDIKNCIFLIYDWEFYRDKLYTPIDFINGKPDTFTEYVSIGERTSMTDKSAFGCGTYRLNLFLPEKESAYALLMPEIYSSCKLYINNDTELEMGDITRNKAEIQSRMVTFKASGQTQILLNVSNKSHYYSGLIYPPTFGSPKELNTIRGLNIFIHSIKFMCAFICFVISIYMGFMLKQSELNIFALLALALSIYSSQELIHYFFSVSSELIYAVGLISYYLIYTFIIALHNKICSVNKTIDIIVTAFSLIVCITAAALAVFSADIYIEGREIISTVLGIYKWLCGAYLIITVVIGARESRSTTLLFGNVFFAVSLVFDRFYPVYEPVYGGWFTEISAVVLIICLGLIQWTDFADALIFKLTFTEEQRQMKKQIAIHKNHYNELSKNIESTRKNYHDMRHHLRVMQNFLKNENYTALANYMDTFEKNMYVAPPISYCKNLTIDALLNYYSQLCQKNNIRFEVKFISDKTMLFPDTDITILLGNLLENAFEACQRQDDSNKFINIKGSCLDNNLLINISNSFSGKIKKSNDIFYSSKEQQNIGLGIKSVNSIVEKYDGLIDFEIGNVFTVMVNIVTCSI